MSAGDVGLKVAGNIAVPLVLRGATVKTMRIVHILTRLLRAGSEENTLLTCAGQIRDGHEVIVMHGHAVLPENALRVAPGARLVEIPALTRELRPHMDVKAYLDLRRQLRALRPDVVHTHQSKAGVLGRLAAASAGVPLIVHGVHILPFLGETGLRRGFYHRAELAVARVTDGYIHVSEGMRDACIAHGVGLGRRHHVVRSGFDLHRFREARSPLDWRDLLKLRPGEDKPFVIAMLASLEPRKRHLHLLRNLREVLTRYPRLRLVFAGEGHMRPEIEAMIAAAGLDGQVTLAGYRTDPERIIAMADLCVHCSEKEGLPRTILQSLTGGRPIVMFRLPGIEEVLVDGINGILLEQGDWAGLGRVVGALVCDEKMRVRLAHGAAETDMSRWDADLMAMNTAVAYRDFAAARRGRTAKAQEAG